MDVWMYGCMDVCMDACMYKCLHGWMDAWMHVCVYVYIEDSGGLSGDIHLVKIGKAT